MKEQINAFERPVQLTDWCQHIRKVDYLSEPFPTGEERADLPTGVTEAYYIFFSEMYVPVDADWSICPFTNCGKVRPEWRQETNTGRGN